MVCRRNLLHSYFIKKSKEFTKRRNPVNHLISLVFNDGYFSNKCRIFSCFGRFYHGFHHCRNHSGRKNRTPYQTGKRPVWCRVLRIGRNVNQSGYTCGICLTGIPDNLNYNLWKNHQYRCRSLNFRATVKTIGTGRYELGANRGVLLYYRYTGYDLKSNQRFPLSYSGSGFCRNHIYHPVYD